MVADAITGDSHRGNQQHRKENECDFFDGGIHFETGFKGVRDGAFTRSDGLRVSEKFKILNLAKRGFYQIIFLIYWQKIG